MWRAASRRKSFRSFETVFFFVLFAARVSSQRYCRAFHSRLSSTRTLQSGELRTRLLAVQIVVSSETFGPTNCTGLSDTDPTRRAWLFPVLNKLPDGFEAADARVEPAEDWLLWTPPRRRRLLHRHRPTGYRSRVPE